MSSDAHAPLVESLLEWLGKHDHRADYIGPSAGEEQDWPLVSADAARQVSTGKADMAIVCCWTGTGAAMAANKVAGVRAALCADAQTATGARKWNDANTLALSIRATAPAVAAEILEAWFATAPGDDAWNRKQFERVAALDEARLA